MGKQTQIKHASENGNMIVLALAFIIVRALVIQLAIPLFTSSIYPRSQDNCGHPLHDSSYNAITMP